MVKEKIFGVTRNVFFLGLVSFFNDFSAEMVQSVMPVFLTVVLGAPAFFVGFVEGIADALSSAFKLISGWLSDKIGKRKRLAVTGYSLSVATRLVLAAVNNFWQVFALRVVDRVGKGFRDSPRDALISESVPPEELGKSFNFHRMMDTLGATLGPLLGFLIIFSFKNSYRFLFLTAFFLGLFAILSFVFVKDVNTKKLDKEAKKVALDWGIFKTHKKFIAVVAALFVLGLGALPIGLVLLKAKEIGSIGEVPLMYFIYSLTFVLVAVPIGKLSDFIGERAVITMGFIVAVFAYIGLAFTHQVITLIFFFVLLGIYSAATDGIQRVIAAKSFEKHLVATGQGFLSMAIGFSSLGAGIVGGFIWTWHSSEAALIYAAAISIVGLIFFRDNSAIPKETIVSFQKTYIMDAVALLQYSPCSFQEIAMRLQELMNEIRREWSFDQQTYPGIEQLHHCDRKFFAIRHILLHQMKANGALAELVERFEHGNDMDNKKLQDLAVKSLKNTLRLADIIGMNAQDLLSCCEQLSSPSM